MIEVLTFPIGPLETNCHLLLHGTMAVAIDPGGDPQPVLDHLSRSGSRLEAILNTHLHCDHIYGNKALAQATGATVYASEGDVFLLSMELGAGGFMGLPRVAPFEATWIQPGDFTFAGLDCHALPTPGHTPGSLSYYFPQAGCVFVGDLLFHRSIGRTDFPGGDYDTLISSVTSRIFTLPEGTAVYSGHGPETTVNDEKSHNPYFQP